MCSEFFWDKGIEYPHQLRLEQEGGHLHQVFNSLENKYKSVSSREDRFWYILTEFENKLYIKDSLFKVKKRNFNKK